MTTAEKLRTIADERGLKEQLKITKDAILCLESAIDGCMDSSGSNIKNKSKLVISMAKVLIAIRVLEHIVGDKTVNSRLKFELEKQLKGVENK